MKKITLLFTGLLFSICLFSQGNTNITIKIPQLDTTKLVAQIFVLDPSQKLDSEYFKDTLEIKNGKCHFNFNIKNPALVTLLINEKYLTFPGIYEVLVEPSDNLTFALPPFKEARFHGFGIENIKIRGKGSKKLNLSQRSIVQYFEVYNSDLIEKNQSLAYRFETTDRKLNAVDSVIDLNIEVSRPIKNLLKAQLYSDILVPLYRVCMVSKSDSLQTLFRKYILGKRRLEVFNKKEVIKYYGSGIVPSSLILSEFKNPVSIAGNNYQNERKIEFAELLFRKLQKNPEIRDYLLSNHLIKTMRRGLDSATVELFGYYRDHVDPNNPNFANVLKIYEEIERKFAVGKPFYDFSLPDSMGKIYSLKDFKGKILVIDFWFNGCVGCKQMVPVLEQLEKVIDNKNIQFISIGIDKRESWLKGIGRYSSPNSLQLFTGGRSNDHPMMKYLNIYSYPRLIVVDREGKILSAPPDPRFNKDGFITYLKSIT